MSYSCVVSGVHYYFSRVMWKFDHIDFVLHNNVAERFLNNKFCHDYIILFDIKHRHISKAYHR